MKYKLLLAISLAFSAPLVSSVWAADAPAANTLTGEVLEVKEVPDYTYLRLKTTQGETWAAVNKSAVKKGAKVTIVDTSVMNNFESKSLKKTFPTIVFGNLGGSGKMAASPHGGATKPVDIGSVKVAKATGTNARTVAETIAKATELKDKPVVIAGKVVKYNGGIMGKNWIHLQDGSGVAASNSNDILVTTTADAKLGEVITVSGVVHTDKDFGAGYTYKVLVEEATLKR